MARKFTNGTTDGIDVGTSTALSPGEMTFGAWVKFISFSATYGSIVSREFSTQTGYTLLVKSTAKLAVYVRTSTEQDVHYDGTGTNTLSTGVWYHLGFSYKASGNLLGFVNGAVDATTAATSNPLASAIATACFIGKSNTSSRVPSASIAEATIWNSQLPTGSMAALAAGAFPYEVHPDGIVAYWPLWGVDSPEPDYSGKQRSGTVTGAVWNAHPPVRRGLNRSNRAFQPMPV